MDTGVQAKIERMRAAAAQLKERRQQSSEQGNSFMASRVHHGPVMARGLHGDPGGSGQVSVAEHEKQDFF